MATVTTVVPRTRRGVELVLLVFAVGIVLMAYANVGLAVDGELPPSMLSYGIGLIVLVGAVHLMLRWKASYADPVMLPIATLLNGLGLVMIHRLDLAEDRSGGGMAARQLIWMTVGVAICLAILYFIRDHRVLQRYTFTAMLAGLALLLLPLVPGLGKNINGSRIWIGVGPLSFQPGELAKILLAMFFAGYLVRTRDSLALVGRKVLGFSLPRARDLGPIIVAWLASLAVLVFERDLGSSLLFFGLFVAMLYVATERKSWILIGLVLFVAGSYLAYLMFGHVQRRVLLWLHPFSDKALEVSDQLVRGLFGMADGGLLGTGLGRGHPDLTYYAESDFIVPSFGEEIGLVGVFALLLLYLVFVERGLRTALGVRDGYGKLLASGLAFTVALQCFVVVGGVTRVIPLTGLTMPFLSAGGSSLVANWAILGLLLRISDQARRPAPAIEPTNLSLGDAPTEVVKLAMNAPIRKLSVLVLVLFGSLLLSSTYIQFVQASALREKPNNRRTLLENYSRQRGPILVTGKPVARSVPSDDDLKYVRQYSSAELYSHLTGYYSFVYGAGAGIERSENDLLSGQADQLFYRRVVDVLTGREQQGASVELTVDPAAQKAAADGLGDQRGAVVALDPRTGAILAMASNPTYDPNELASHDLAKVQAAYKRLLADPDDPLVNRTIQALYPPGSTFKVVTAATALSSGSYTENSVVPGPAVLDLPQTTANLRNDFSGSCGPNDKVDLTTALEISCNTAFAALGLTLGDDAIRAQAEKFGFGDRIGVPMPVAPSIFPADMNKPQTAQAAIGQYDVRVTPLQMAMVAAGVANDGVVMAPYSVKTSRSPDLDVIEQAKPQELSRAVDPGVSDQLTRMMEQVVESGTGTRAQIPGIKVAGKTGTAQHAKGQPPHAWFICFAPADDPKVAVAVVVEDGGKAGNEAFGGRIAAPIAKDVMEAVLR